MKFSIKFYLIRYKSRFYLIKFKLIKIKIDKTRILYLFNYLHFIKFLIFNLNLIIFLNKNFISNNKLYLLVFTFAINKISNNILKNIIIFFFYFINIKFYTYLFNDFLFAKPPFSNRLIILLI